MDGEEGGNETKKEGERERGGWRGETKRGKRGNVRGWDDSKRGWKRREELNEERGGEEERRERGCVCVGKGWRT